MKWLRAFNFELNNFIDLSSFGYAYLLGISVESVTGRYMSSLYTHQPNVNHII